MRAKHGNRIMQNQLLGRWRVATLTNSPPGFIVSTSPFGSRHHNDGLINGPLTLGQLRPAFPETDMGKSSQDLQARLQALRDDFAAQLPQRIAAIAQAWQARGAAMPDDLRELYRKVHSLSGAAGTFGMPELGEQARRVEDQLRPVLHNPPQLADDFEASVSAGIAALRARVADVVPMAAATAVPGVDEPREPAATATEPLVYLFEEDADRSARLEAKLAPFGYRMRVFHQRGQLLAAVRQDRPLALIMDFRTPEVQAVCTADLSKYQQMHDDNLPVIFIAGDTRFEGRLRAARAGCYAFLEQPVDISLLIERLHSLRVDQSAEPYRAMIIEDDALLTDHYVAVLKAAGVSTCAVPEPARVIAALAEFQPDVLLMDLHLPDCEGRDIAWLIRQDPAYLSMPIVYLSAETDPAMQYDALMMGGDDFITKPIDDRQLIAVVRSRAHRARMLRDAMARDSLTGLLKHTKIAEQLQIEAARAHRNGTPLSFAMLDIDLFKRVNDTYGHAAGDRVIRSLAQLLRQRLRSTDSVGRYGGEEFAVVLPDTDAAGASALLEDLRAAFAALEFEAGTSVFSVSFSAGIATTLHPSAIRIAETADRALYDAKRGGRNRIVCIPE